MATINKINLNSVLYDLGVSAELINSNINVQRGVVEKDGTVLKFSSQDRQGEYSTCGIFSIYIVHTNDVISIYQSDDTSDVIGFTTSSNEYKFIIHDEDMLMLNGNTTNSAYPLTLNPDRNYLIIVFHGTAYFIGDIVNVYDINNTLSWGNSVRIANINGTYITATLPSNPNTHYTTRLYAGASGTATNTTASNPYLKVTDDNTYRNEVRFLGTGGVTVKSTSTNSTTGIIQISGSGDTKNTVGATTNTTTSSLYLVNTLATSSAYAQSYVNTNYFIKNNDTLYGTVNDYRYIKCGNWNTLSGYINPDLYSTSAYTASLTTKTSSPLVANTNTKYMRLGRIFFGSYKHQFACTILLSCHSMVGQSSYYGGNAFSCLINASLQQGNNMSISVTPFSCINGVSNASSFLGLYTKQITSSFDGSNGVDIILQLGNQVNTAVGASAVMLSDMANQPYGDSYVSNFEFTYNYMTQAEYITQHNSCTIPGDNSGNITKRVYNKSALYISPTAPSDMTEYSLTPSGSRTQTTTIQIKETGSLFNTTNGRAVYSTVSELINATATEYIKPVMINSVDTTTPAQHITFDYRYQSSGGAFSQLLPNGGGDFYAIIRNIIQTYIKPNSNGYTIGRTITLHFNTKMTNISTSGSSAYYYWTLASMIGDSAGYYKPTNPTYVHDCTITIKQVSYNNTDSDYMISYQITPWG